MDTHLRLKEYINKFVTLIEEESEFFTSCWSGRCEATEDRELTAP